MSYLIQKAEYLMGDYDNYVGWVETNEDVILEAYIESITINEVPKEFIEELYERYKERDLK